MVIVSRVMTQDGKAFEAKFVIIAVGREGSSWLSGEAKRLGLSVQKNPVDIGVRVELPAYDHERDNRCGL